MRDQTYKQEMREPEPTKHPDERMHMTIKNSSLQIETKPTEFDPETKKPIKVMRLAKGGEH